MGKFTKSITRSYQFDGDEITIVINRMNRKDAMKLVPYVGQPDEEGNVKMEFEDQMKMIDVVADFMPKYVTSIAGLPDAETNSQLSTEQAKERIFEESYYIGLIGEIVGDWTEASFMFETKAKDDVVKKLDVPPSDTSPELETPAISPLEE